MRRRVSLFSYLSISSIWVIKLLILYILAISGIISGVDDVDIFYNWGID